MGVVAKEIYFLLGFQKHGQGKLDIQIIYDLENLNDNFIACYGSFNYDILIAYVGCFRNK